MSAILGDSELSTGRDGVSWETWGPLRMELIWAFVVPKRGLEPPHPCEYMDLNHARLPIPPLRHVSRLVRTRGSWTWQP